MKAETTGLTKHLLTQARAFNYKDVGPKTNLLNRFEKAFDRWIHSSEQSVKGLPKEHFIVSGVTDAFNQLYGLYERIGVFDGEYMYHQNVLNERTTTNLEDADCIIISHPFSGDGMCSHDKIKIADKLNKPIFIDCALFGICCDIDFNFEQYKNIHSVCFSLSKVFGTGLNRVGLLYTKDKFPCTIYNTWGYPLVSSAEYHYGLIDTIGPDNMPKQYKDKQIKICKELELTPSPTVIFGIDYTNKYSEYKRGPSNRVCITNLLEDK